MRVSRATPRTTPSPPPPRPPANTGPIVNFAYAALGTPYVYAGSGPGGYDCSGLTAAAWLTAGVRLAHNAATQWGQVRHVTRGQLLPGDLVFYAGLGHVGLYVGAGRIIHAPQPGDVVRLAPVDMMPPYGYGRPG